LLLAYISSSVTPGCLICKNNTTKKLNMQLGLLRKSPFMVLREVWSG